MKCWLVRCLVVAWRLLGGCSAMVLSLLEAWISFVSCISGAIDGASASFDFQNIRQNWRLDPSGCRERPPQNAVKTNVFVQNRFRKCKKHCKLQCFLHILPKNCLPNKPKKLHPEGQNLTNVSRNLMKMRFCNLDFLDKNQSTF